MNKQLSWPPSKLGGEVSMKGGCLAGECLDSHVHVAVICITRVNTQTNTLSDSF